MMQYCHMKLFEMRAVKVIIRHYNASMRFRFECYGHKLSPEADHIEKVNRFGYEVMASNVLYKNTIANPIPRRSKINPLFQYNDLVQYLNDARYKNETVSETVTSIAEWNSLPIDLNDSVFDNFVDHLMDKCPELNDDELLDMISYLSFLSPTNSINFTDIWSCLDDLCIWRHKTWSLDRILLTLDYWYKVKLFRISQMSYLGIRYLSRKPQLLTRPQLVHSCFLMNMLRKEFEMVEFEFELLKYLNEFSLDEIGIIAMSCFKTKYHIKSQPFLEHMLKLATKNIKTSHEMTLSAIARAVQLALNLQTGDEILAFQKSVISETDQLSISTLLNILLMGASKKVIDDNLAIAVSLKIVNNIKNVTLKNIENLVFVLKSFFIQFDDDIILKKIVDELLNENRQKEIEERPRIFYRTMSYLATFEIYPQQLLKRVFDTNLLKMTYGSNTLKYGRELLIIDASIDAEQPKYKGLRLSDCIRHQLAKIYTDWAPSETSKTSNSFAKLFINVKHVLSEIVGGEDYFRIEHILPHFQHPSIVVAINRKTNQFVRVNDYFQNYFLGHVMRQHSSDDGIQWFAFISSSRSQFFYNSDRPLGLKVMKMRQIKAIGYEPILIYWLMWEKLNEQEKIAYIQNQLFKKPNT